jgi:hypothetical protein
MEKVLAPFAPYADRLRVVVRLSRRAKNLRDWQEISAFEL